MHLNEYILTANRFINAMVVTNHQFKQHEADEDGVTVFYRQDVYQFADNKQLVCDREVDDVDDDLPQTVCKECWITYVLTDAAGQVLGKKSFTSFCQESFWLKRQYHQLDIEPA